MSAPALHLASASVRRREILRALGLIFSYGGEALDERRAAGESAADMVVRLALQKAAAAQPRKPGCAVLGADTAVVLDDDVFGKPASREDALDMLRRLSGRTHEVMTGIALLHGDTRRSVLCVTRVRFRDISDAEALAYWQSGEARDMAGAYAIQGRAGAFAADLNGSYSGVVGLPVFETAALLRAAGIDILRPGAAAGG